MTGWKVPEIPFPFPTVSYRPGAVVLIDQTRLPAELVWRECRDVEALCHAIGELAVRGAPAIGIAAGYGLVLAAELAAAAGSPPDRIAEAVQEASARLAATRPTAVNLTWALDRVGALARSAAAAGSGGTDLVAALQREADRILAEDLQTCRRLGAAGAALLPDPARVLTHCNAGGLATGGYGTALGVVYAARQAGKRVEVFADETRPLLQGARLTAWELASQGIPVRVLCDGAAATLLRRGQVDAVITGADRIARNGDTANKIGTYPLAVLARRHGVPFYVAAPASTFDPRASDGGAIVVEERSETEVTHCGGRPVVPPGVPAFNPAFDVTPASLVTGFVTEHGVRRPPYETSLQPVLAAARLDSPGSIC